MRLEVFKVFMIIVIILWVLGAKWFTSIIHNYVRALHIYPWRVGGLLPPPQRLMWHSEVLCSYHISLWGIGINIVFFERWRRVKTIQTLELFIVFKRNLITSLHSCQSLYSFYSLFPWMSYYKCTDRTSYLLRKLCAFVNLLKSFDY